MNTCKTCKHWKRSADYEEKSMCEPWDFEAGRRINEGIEVRICQHPAKTFSEGVTEANGFGITDASGYMALLATGEAFGCVRHERAS